MSDSQNSDRDLSNRLVFMPGQMENPLPLKAGPTQASKPAPQARQAPTNPGAALPPAKGQNAEADDGGLRLSLPKGSTNPTAAPKPETRAKPQIEEAQKLIKERQPDAAKAKLLEALKVDPEAIQAHSLLATLAEQTNAWPDVVRHLERCVALAPRHPDLRFRLGNAYGSLNQHAKAVEQYKVNIAEKPGAAAAYVNMGISLRNLKKEQEAVVAYRKAIEIDPKLPEAYSNLASSLETLEDIEGAVTAFYKAIELRPDYVRAYTNLGFCLARNRRAEEAIEICRKAVELAPKAAEAQNNLGFALQAGGRYAEALEHFAIAVDLDNGGSRYLSNLGVLEKEVGRTAQAISTQRKAIALKPKDSGAYWNESMVQLLVGNFHEGWALYDHRWGTEDFIRSIRPFEQPMWDGAPLDPDTRFLIHTEQGVGDTVHFGRYVELVAEMNPETTIFFEVQPSLVSLYRRSLKKHPNVTIVEQQTVKGENLPQFDIHLPLACMPLVFETDLDDVPVNVPYFQVAKARDYKKNKKDFVIGISWWTKNKNVGHKRSVPLERLAELAKLPGVRLVDLQYGDTAEERARVEKELGVEIIHDDVDAVADLDAFSEQVKGCDLVISIDNTTVHIAGALGVPCFVLLAYVPDWRWMLQREDSPWYPSLKLYRQDQPGEWDPVLTQMRTDVEKLLGGDKKVLQAKPWKSAPARTPKHPI